MNPVFFPCDDYRLLCEAWNGHTVRNLFAHRFPQRLLVNTRYDLSVSRQMVEIILFLQHKPHTKRPRVASGVRSKRALLVFILLWRSDNVGGEMDNFLQKLFK